MPIAGVRQLELEIKWFPIAIKDEVDMQALHWQLGAERYAVRMFAPVRIVELHPMPATNSFANQLGQGHPQALSLGASQ
jgi:hypothetical protein